MGQTFFFILFLSLFSISFISAKFVPAKLIREQYEFFHISDIHYDPLANPILYNASTYCRPPSSENIGTIDHSTHTKGGGVWDSPAGQYGRYGCDTPDELLTSVLIGMQKINSNPDFIIFTGDSPAHNLSPSDQIDAIDHVITRIFTVFSGTSIIPTIGNNDVYPDYTVSCNDPRIYEIYKSYNEFIPSEMAATFLQMGSFMNPVVQGLRVISLNTVLYSSRNTAISGDDPCGQFAWFSGELNAARNSGDKVYIVGHIFPGIDPDKLLPLWYPSYITKYIDIVSQYSDIIYGSFFGHVHRDEFRILNDPSDVKSPPQASILASSSVSPIYANNPTFRIYYTNASFGLDDYADYILDLPQANVMNYANWSMEYSFHDSYGQEFINTDNLANVYKQIQNQANIFSEWYDRRVGQYQASKQASLCVLNSPDSISFDDCMNQPYV